MKLYKVALSGLFWALAWLAMGMPAVSAASAELSMQECVAMALKNNYAVKYAKSAKEKSYWALQQAEKNKGVSVDFTHTDQRYNTAPTSSQSQYTYTTKFDNQLTLSVPLYSGKNLEDQIDQAKINLSVADLEITAQEQQLQLTVITDYLTVLEYQNVVRINQATVENDEEHLQLVQNKFDLGMVAKTDVLSSQVDLATAQDNLVQAQNNYANAVAALNNAMGLPHDTTLVLKDDFSFKKETRTLEECLQYAIAHRPELAQYAAKLVSAQYDVDIAKSGQRPTVTLTAQQDWNDSHLPGMDNSNWLVKVTTSLNVFDAGITDTKIKQAEHSVKMVEEQAAQEQDSILLAVRQYYLSMSEAEKRIATSEVSVQKAEENVTIQKACYDAGVGTNLDLRDAVLSLDSARKDHVQALYDYSSNKAKLEQAMGLSLR